MVYPSRQLLDKLADLLGPKGYSAEAEELTPWLADWRGRYHGNAAAMLSPASREEVMEIVALCASEGVSLVPQGGNTSMVGGATPPAEGEALLLSLRRMNRIRSLDPDANLAICEAGVILADLHSAALGLGRRFPLTLGSKGSATIGGLASTNAGGTQVLRFGTMRGLVRGIEAVLPDGSLFNGLSPLKKDNRGYSLDHLLVGSEGTLGVITRVVLRLLPRPRPPHTLVASFTTGGTPRVCPDDGDRCTAESCDPAAAMCISTPVADCSAGIASSASSTVSGSSMT